MKKDIGNIIEILLGILIITLCIVTIFSFTNKSIEYTQQKTTQPIVKERRITIYDIHGEIQREYRGKYSISYDNEYIIFTSEDGLSHTIYSPMETIIVDDLEIKKEKTNEE